MEFKTARDFLLRNRSTTRRRIASFGGRVPMPSNWALDWFDTIADGNERPGLWIVDDGDIETRLSFAELSARSNALAGWLHEKGRTPG